MTALADYEVGLREWRSEGLAEWRRATSKYVGRPYFSNEGPPAFFADMYGFRSWCSRRLGRLDYVTAIPEVDLDQYFETYEENVRESLLGCDLLNVPAPNLDHSVARSAFLDDLFGQWAAHLGSYGIAWPLDAADWFFKVTLMEVFKKSVFYPRPPALWGPTFFAKVADRDRACILKKFGKAAVWEFYFAMMVFHEQSHFLQRGEPLLNEIGHAIVWNDFVHRHGLGMFQVNSDTGRTCNQEAPYIVGRLAGLRSKNLSLLFADNATFFRQVSAEVPYSVIVAMAWLVHIQALSYRSFVNFVCGFLADDETISVWAAGSAADVVGGIVFQVGSPRATSPGFKVGKRGERRTQDKHLVRAVFPCFDGVSP